MQTMEMNATTVDTDDKEQSTKSMSNSPSKGPALMAYTRFTLDRSTPSLWRVTFNHPPRAEQVCEARGNDNCAIR